MISADKKKRYEECEMKKKTADILFHSVVLVSAAASKLIDYIMNKTYKRASSWGVVGYEDYSGAAHRHQALPWLHGSNLFQLDMAAGCTQTHVLPGTASKLSDGMHSDLMHTYRKVENAPVKTHAQPTADTSCLLLSRVIKATWVHLRKVFVREI